MSRNAVRASPKAVKKTDRRVRRTRDALGDALVELMHEKPFAQITVQHVLDRAGVSRSTFYTHYRDKDDLFLSDVEDFLEQMASLLSRRGEVSNRIAPVRELFAHVADWREFHGVLVKAGKIHDFLELGQGYFARAIEQRLSELPLGRGLAPTNRAAVAQMHAGALLSLLMWWLNQGTPGSAAEMDAFYHERVWSGIGRAARDRM
ncbi:MAG: TetR/AcrR family transcriptional regulator [Acidobacteriia bacterium]|nr:TetR/AcrR family transcriptional regulator [Terriglobia bacterium]